MQDQARGLGGGSWADFHEPGEEAAEASAAASLAAGLDTGVGAMDGFLAQNNMNTCLLKASLASVQMGCQMWVVHILYTVLCM